MVLRSNGVENNYGDSTAAARPGAATGVITFTPDAGFYGTAALSYVVYDNWRVGVRADITVTVTAGCTITDHLDGGPDSDDCTRGDTVAGCETESRQR